MLQYTPFVDQPATYWLILGVILLIAELVIPQLFVVFLGLGALLVAGLIYLEWVNHWEIALGLWIVLSAGLLLVLRSFLMRLAPGESETLNIDEDQEALGREVEVISVQADDPRFGRVSFRGTGWDAHCPDEAMHVGQKVRLVTRNNLRWQVESIAGDGSLPHRKES